MRDGCLKCWSHLWETSGCAWEDHCSLSEMMSLTIPLYRKEAICGSITPRVSMSSMTHGHLNTAIIFMGREYRSFFLWSLLLLGAWQSWTCILSGLKNLSLTWYWQWNLIVHSASLPCYCMQCEILCMLPEGTQAVWDCLVSVPVPVLSVCVD